MPIIKTIGNAGARGYGFTAGAKKATVSWTPVPAGTPFTTGSYSGVTFTASATFTITDGPLTIEALVVGGGGAGGAKSPTTPPIRAGGGGGAGGYLPIVGDVLASNNYAVVIGAGGALASVGGSDTQFGPYIARAGGSGRIGVGYQGASGGGGGGSAGGNLGGAATTPSQGNPGYAATGSTPNVIAGGGGGAGAGGPAPTPNRPGGNGTSNSLTGTPITYAGGGGGGRAPSTAAGTGGSGGGGNGAGAAPTVPNSVASTAGEANTGGGGGGSAQNTAAQLEASEGGSGVVIVRWLT